MDKYWQVKKPLPNETNREIVNEFLLHLKISNRSDITIKGYREQLERFFMAFDEPYTDLTPPMILAWVKNNLGHLKESSLQRYFYVLSSFFNFCVQETYLERSPIKKRWYPRVPKAIPKYLPKEEIAKTRHESEKNILRNQALVEFMLTSGCRVGEVYRLNREDLDLENRTAKVKGKGKKIRFVHFTDKCAILLERYMNATDSPSCALFTTVKGNQKGKRLTIRGIQRTISVIGEKAEIASGLHPHRLRHTFATELLAKGAELSFISDELGHSNLNTTLIYARLPQQAIISQYRKYMG